MEPLLRTPRCNIIEIDLNYCYLRRNYCRPKILFWKMRTTFRIFTSYMFFNAGAVMLIFWPCHRVTDFAPSFSLMRTT